MIVEKSEVFKEYLANPFCKFCVIQESVWKTNIMCIDDFPAGNPTTLNFGTLLWVILSRMCDCWELRTVKWKLCDRPGNKYRINNESIIISN